MQLLEMQKKLDACEKALAKKQFEIDEIKELAAKSQADSETIDVLRAQVRPVHYILLIILTPYEDVHVHHPVGQGVWNGLRS